MFIYFNMNSTQIYYNAAIGLTHCYHSSLQIGNNMKLYGFEINLKATNNSLSMEHTFYCNIKMHLYSFCIGSKKYFIYTWYMRTSSPNILIYDICTITKHWLPRQQANIYLIHISPVFNHLWISKIHKLNTLLFQNWKSSWYYWLNMLNIHTSSFRIRLCVITDSFCGRYHYSK